MLYLLLTLIPSLTPSSNPSSKPSLIPTLIPTLMPSSQPSSMPSFIPIAMSSSQPRSTPFLICMINTNISSQGWLLFVLTLIKQSVMFFFSCKRKTTCAATNGWLLWWLQPTHTSIKDLVTMSIIVSIQQCAATAVTDAKLSCQLFFSPIDPIRRARAWTVCPRAWRWSTPSPPHCLQCLNDTVKGGQGGF